MVSLVRAVVRRRTFDEYTMLNWMTIEPAN
jgi:hypothetical protein